MIAEIAIKKDKIKSVSKRYSLEEYFHLEEKAPNKNEFVNGKIIPMSGGTINHGNLGGTIYALLLMLFFNTEEDINVYSSDQKVYITPYNKNTYTDTCVVIGQTETYKGGNQAILNPTLIVEVSSKSTEQYDRSGKFRMYQSLPSFKEYVIVNQDMPIIEVFYKIEENKWQMTSYTGLDKVVKFDTLNVELKMSDIYKKAVNLKDPQAIIEFPEDDEKM